MEVRYNDGRKFFIRAIAYLKASVPEQDPAPVVTLTGLDAPVFRSLNNGLLVSYVVDTGDEYQFVQYRHLAQDSATEDELHAAGLGNLLALAAGSLRVAPHPKGQMFAVLMGGNFEASLILLDCLWDDSFRQFAAGQYAIAIPAQHIGFLRLVIGRRAPRIATSFSSGPFFTYRPSPFGSVVPSNGQPLAGTGYRLRFVTRSWRCVPYVRTANFY